MKKVLALIFSFVILLSGCSFATENGLFGSASSSLANTGDTYDNKTYTPQDSTVTLDVYPQVADFTTVGKFERLQYSGLSELQKSIYIRLDNAVFNMQTGYVDVGECSYRDLELAFFALRCDRPEYFWLPNTYSLRVVGKRRQIRFADNDAGWVCTKEERLQTESQIKTSLQQFLGGVSSDDGQYELELKAHDWLAEKIIYDHDAIDNYDAYPEAWTIEGAFVDGKAVCEGYSKAMQLMCYMVGIDCSIVTGTTSNAHMWNVVKIDGQWYHLDLTFNDGDNNVYHSFFNVTNESVEKSRMIDASAKDCDDEALQKGRYNLFVPICSSTQDNYFNKNSAYVTAKNQFESTVVSLVYSAITNGKNCVEIGFAPELNFVYGRSDIDDMGDVEKYFVQVNSELSYKQQIKRYKVSGINGASSIMLSWE